VSKITDLESALKDLVKPGMAVHLTTQARAVTRALQRVFHGQALDLTLIMGRIGGGNGADLLASGLVKRVLAGSYGAVSRHYTGPLPQVQQTYASGQVSFQHWSFMSLTQRLMAGAQGVPFVPTHSLADTSMARDNAPDYARLPDPSGRCGDIGVVTALQPDLAALHVIACDEDGNAILLPPMEEGAWGARASRGGAIVTTEHIVSRDFIRAHAHLVRLPARYVRAVCHVPFGAHPGSFGSTILPELGVYADDEDFNQVYLSAVRDSGKLSEWVQRWILQGSHASYLEQLTDSHLSSLRQRAESRHDAAAPDVAQLVTRFEAAEHKPPGETEIMMTLALRQIIRRVNEHGHDLLLVGAGLSEVPATAARTLMREQGKDVTLIMGHGYYGFEPFPGHSEPQAGATLMTTDSSDIYTAILAGRRGACLALLGTAQVDCHGNLNSTLAGGRLLTGSGGSNDAAATCDTIVVTGMSRRKLVQQVDYITSPGTNVRAVITESGVFEPDPATGRLTLTGVVIPAGRTQAECLEDIASRCGWVLEVSAHLQAIPSPETRELAVIRWLMPSRYQ